MNEISTLWYEPAIPGRTICDDDADVPHDADDDAGAIRTPPAGVVIRTAPGKKPSDSAVEVSADAVTEAFGPEWTAGLQVNEYDANPQTRQLLANVLAGGANPGNSRYRVQIAPTAAHHPALMPRESTAVVTDPDTGFAVMITALGTLAPRAWGKTTAADCWRPMRVTAPGLPSAVAHIVDAASEHRPECPRVRTLLSAAATHDGLKRRSSQDVEMTYVDQAGAEHTDRTTSAVFLEWCGRAFRPARQRLGRPGWVIDLQEQDGQWCQLRKTGADQSVTWRAAGPRNRRLRKPPDTQETADAVDLLDTLVLLARVEWSGDWPDGPDRRTLLRSSPIEPRA